MLVETNVHNVIFVELSHVTIITRVPLYDVFLYGGYLFSHTLFFFLFFWASKYVFCCFCFCSSSSIHQIHCFHTVRLFILASENSTLQPPPPTLHPPPSPCHDIMLRKWNERGGRWVFSKRWQYVRRWTRSIIIGLPTIARKQEDEGWLIQQTSVSVYTPRFASNESRRWVRGLYRSVTYCKATPTSNPYWLLLLLLSCEVQSCFTCTETVRTVRDGEPRTTTSTFTQLLSSACGVSSFNCLLY